MRTADAWLQKLSLCGNPKRIDKRKDKSYAKERTIGTTTLKTPYIGMGTWAIGGGTWWGENDDALSIRTIEEAIDRGIVWFDTAPVYGIGHSENVVGKAIKQNRSRILLSTKCGLEWDHETPCFHKVMEGRNVYRDLSASAIRKNLEDSLRRLQTDYIDIYYTHWQTPDFSLYPLEETMDTLLQLKKKGRSVPSEPPTLLPKSSKSTALLDSWM